MNEYIRQLLVETKAKEHWKRMQGDSRQRMQGEERCAAIDELLAVEAVVADMVERIEELEEMLVEAGGQFFEICVSDDADNYTDLGGREDSQADGDGLGNMVKEAKAKTTKRTDRKGGHR